MKSYQRFFGVGKHIPGDHHPVAVALVLECARLSFLNACPLWVEFDLTGKRRFHATLFPD